MKRFEAFADAICAEASSRKEEIASTLKVNTLYVGGGTPSVLPPSVFERIVRALPYGPFDEFTMEANPEDIVEKGPDYLAFLRGLGVNRLSMGIQGFDDALLRWMNRRHDSSRALKAFHMAREAGFGNISIDLMFGISGLSDECWEKTTSQAIALRPEHISAYQLSIEEGSALEEMTAKGQYTEASEDICRRQYDTLCRKLAEAGYVHYEVSNFALPGYMAVHNSAYWRRVPYVGLGPGAHSFDGKARRWNNPDYSSETEELSPEDIRVETIMLGLRTATGVARDLVPGCDALEKEGALISSGSNVRIPEDRFFVSDDIIRRLI